MPFLNRFFNNQNTGRTDWGKEQEACDCDLFLKSPDAVFVMNAEGRIVTINKKLTALLGYKLFEIEKIKKNLTSENNEKLKHHIHLAMNRIPSSFSIVLTHKKGHSILVNMTLTPSVGKEKPSFIFGLCKRMTELRAMEEEMDKLADDLEEAQSFANIGSWEYDVKGGKFFWSKQAYQIFGIGKTDVTIGWKDYLNLIHPSDAERFEKTFANAIDGKGGCSTEHRIIRVDGEERIVIQRTNLMLDERQKIVRLFGTIQDITEKKQIECELEENKKWFQSVANHLPVGIWSFDVVKRKITFCSKGIEDIYGITREVFNENPLQWLEFIHPMDFPHVSKERMRLFAGEKLTLRYWITDGKGQEKWISNQIIPFMDADNNVIRIDGITQDITEEKKYTDALAFLANHDQLTGLPNRHYFNKQINELIEKSRQDEKQFSVFSIDLDRFKYINDTFGYEVGDKLLRAFPTRLNKILGKDAFIARLEGDGFVLCVKGLHNQDDYFQLATTIIDEVKKPFHIDDYEFFITASIGISFYPIDGDDAFTLLKNAASALHKAKEHGRNDWEVYSASVNIESFKRYQLENDMRKAIENEEFFLELQPKVNAKTGKIKGAEALIRWHHPEWGIVSPGEFIPLAEENGCIFEMGDWVLREVCRLLRHWQKEGISVVPISINVSPKRLLKTDFVASVKNAIEQANIQPSLIELELTENVVIRNMETTRRVITELKDYGVQFALDDFGTGYSSLTYLKELDIDTLKIDKSFIDGINKNKVNEGISKGVIFLAKELGVKVVAEGVEQKEQLHFLVQQECSQIQGYLFSKPVRKDDFKRLLFKGFLRPLGFETDEHPLKNRREYFRLSLPFPLRAEMTIVKFKNKEIKIGKSHTLIENISLGGLKYVSNINLPVQEDLILQFTTTILGKQVQFIGKTVWKAEMGEFWEYGFEFMMNEKERDDFSTLFNQLSLQLKHSSNISTLNYWHGDRVRFFEENDY